MIFDVGRASYILYIKCHPHAETRGGQTSSAARLDGFPGKAYLIGMTKREFTRRVLNGKTDVLQIFLDALRAGEFPFCVIGGLAVNAYVDPVVSLDLDIVIVADRIKDLAGSLPPGFKLKPFPNSINISAPGADLRIQVQTDPRYQPFLARSKRKSVLGYPMRVAAVEDVLQGKIWAALDDTRRPSKRQKDLADILRLVESRPALASRVPATLKKKLSF
jgi:hypothetical protein